MDTAKDLSVDSTTMVSKEKTYAFFDVDDTLIAVKSMFSFQDYWYSKYPDFKAQHAFDRDMNRRHEPNVSWEKLNALYYSHFSGRNVDALLACGKAWFDELENVQENLFHAPIVNVLRQHQAQGHEVVFVSGSFPAVLLPVAERLGVHTILAINMDVKNGHYTGRILPPQTIGEGKAQAIRDYLLQVGGEADNCYAYGDDISDLPMLKSVGKPHVVSGGRGLEKVAKQECWPVLSPTVA